MVDLLTQQVLQSEKQKIWRLRAFFWKRYVDIAPKATMKVEGETATSKLTEWGADFSTEISTLSAAKICCRVWNEHGRVFLDTVARLDKAWNIIYTYFGGHDQMDSKNISYQTPSRPFDFTWSEIWAVHMCRAQQNYFCPRTLELTKVCEWEHALPAKAGRVGSATCTSGVSWRNRHRHCPLNEPRCWKKRMKGWSCWPWFEGGSLWCGRCVSLLPKLRQKFLEREAIAYRERDKEHAVFCNEMHAIVFPKRNRFRIGRILVRYWTHSCPLL